MKNFLIVDFEFTFYRRPVGRPRAFFSEIIEIGAVLLNGETFELMGKLQNFVQPQFFPKQSKDAMDFCMITPKDMKKAITFPKMVEELGALYVPGETLFVTWGNADYPVLNTACTRYKLANPILPEDCLDLAEAYRLTKGDSRTTGLKAAAEEQEVGADGLWHTAFDDANNTGKVLVKLLQKGWQFDKYVGLLRERRDED